MYAGAFCEFEHMTEYVIELGLGIGTRSENSWRLVFNMNIVILYNIVYV